MKTLTSILFSMLINQPSKLYTVANLTIFSTVFLTVVAFLKIALHLSAPLSPSVINVPEIFSSKVGCNKCLAQNLDQKLKSAAV